MIPTRATLPIPATQNTFYALPAGPGEPAAAASLAECAERCLALPMCRAWSWCPPEEEGGCSTPIYYCSQPFEASPGTCALSEDGADTVAFVKIDGEPSVEPAMFG